MTLWHSQGPWTWNVPELSVRGARADLNPNFSVAQHLVTLGTVGIYCTASCYCCHLPPFLLHCVLLCRKLALFDEWNSLAVYVSMDNTVVIEDISESLACLPSQVVGG